jgi:hypothetical protein
MGFSKIVRRTENKISRAVPVANKIVSTAGSVLGKVGSVAEKVSSVSGKILNNPIVEGIVASQPELLPAYGLAVGASKMIGQGGKAAEKGSAVAGKVSNVLEKVSSATQSKPAMSFA